MTRIHQIKGMMKIVMQGISINLKEGNGIGKIGGVLGMHQSLI
jgi:hypothetical protein